MQTRGPAVFNDTNSRECIGPVVKNRSFIGVFYNIKGVHCATIERSKSRFIGLVCLSWWFVGQVS